MRASLWLFAWLAVLACSRAQAAPPLAALMDIHVESGADANFNNATRVDLVWVYDQATLSALPRTAPRWFSDRDQLMSQLGSALDVVRIDMPPVSMVRPALPVRHGKAIAVLAYVDMLAEAGQKLGDLTAYRCARVVIAKSSVDYRPC